VEAGPKRTESITEEVLSQVLDAAKVLKPKVVDLTGGAPEMCPLFRKAVTAFRELGSEVLVRSNLTILVEPGFEDMIDFLNKQRVRIIASLPCYTEENVDKQRGAGVFQASIKALKKLNAAGFGVADSGLVLDLVYNPGGPALPGGQEDLERDYKRTLGLKYGITFSSLLCIANLPIGRFYSDLKKLGQDKAYDELLLASFNPETVQHLMCRNTLNVSWDGWIYDCDFNQMIELPARHNGQPLHISDIEGIQAMIGGRIEIGNHCFGCTAGTGSSCGGALVTG
jgi:radical SAM/Cys-rich protein